MGARAVNQQQLSAAALGERAGPRYATLARLLSSEIASGRYGVGDLIPTEAELQQRFDVSRHTVREALRELKDRGLVSARAGIGTVVRAKVPGARYMMGVGGLRELIQFAETTRTRLVTRREVIADEDLAQRLESKPGQQWMEASILRYPPEGNAPVALMSIFVRPEHADVFDLIERARQPVYSLLERHHGVRVAEVKQQIIAVTLGKAAARTLGARAGSPALEITRHYFDAQDRIAMVSIGQYPSDRFSHTTKFRIQTEESA
jgi:DNA-binding GntR family transcriptional regulator